MKLFVSIISAILVAVLLEISFFAEIPNFDYSSEIGNNVIFSNLQQARLPFVENQGQIPSESVKYYANTFAGTVYVTDSDLTYYSIKKENDSATTFAIKERFLGNPLQPNGAEKSQATVSYFKGSQENWKTNIPTFDGVSLGAVWPYVDVNLNAYGNNVEKIFTVHPGGKSSDIRMSFEGISGLSLSKNNELVVDTDLGSVVLSKPIAYQNIDGRRHDVTASYDVIDSNTYGFSVLSYDPRFELVIDPLIASTFIGAEDIDEGLSIVLDSSGNVYVTGYTLDVVTDYPTTAGAYDTTQNGFYDVFVSKFNGNLATLSASTFIGGSNSEQGYGIALDSSGNVYITGNTVDGVTDYPTTAGAYDTTHNGTYDVFVSKLNSALTTLSASTLIGGSDNDFGYGIAIDNSTNDVYITGETNDAVTDFPTTAGAYDTTQNGASDVFVSKFNSNLTTLSASTFIGGSGGDIARSIALDSSGNVYITGYTPSAGTQYPTTAGAYDTTQNGASDVFVSKLNSTLTTLSASTFIGGGGDDIARSIALDSSGNVYIIGYTFDHPTDLPTTAGAYDTTHNGSDDVFVSKFNSNLTTLSASTLIGGGENDYGYGIALDSFGHVFITGQTFDATTDFPTTAGAYDTTHNGSNDVFVSKLNGNLTTLSASTYIGGAGVDYGYSIALDDSDSAYVTGYTSHHPTVFPTTTGAYDTTHNGNEDVFISVFDCNLSASGSVCQSSGTLSTGGSVVIPVGAGGTAQVELPSGNDLAVVLPAAVAATVTITDTDSGSSDASIGFFGDITDIDVSGSGCSTGCTLSFTFTGEDADAAGLSPSAAVVYHDSNENGSFESGEGLSTTVSGSDPYTATATASFTSKFAVGGVRALAIAAVASQVLGVGQDGCDPDGFGSGISLRVYSISYDKCETNKIDIVAHSTCGPISAEIASNYGTKFAAISDHQPFFKDMEKRVIYSASLDPELESVNVIVKDKRDSFVDKLYLNQCTASKSYTHTTGYTTEQQGPSFGNETQSNMITPTVLAQKELDIPSWIKNNAEWWSSGQITDSEFSQGIEYLIKQDIIDVAESAKIETTQESKQIPSWIKTNSKWWAEGMISDSEFTKGLEYLIKMGVIRV